MPWWMLLFCALLIILPPSFKSLSVPSSILQSQGLLVQPHPNVYVLGTVHVGNASVQDVKELIESVRPSVVIVEISSSRLDKIRQNDSEQSVSSSSSPSPSFWTILPTLMERGWKVGGFGGFMFSLAMSYSLLRKPSSGESPSRVDEFATAVFAADVLQAKVIAADFELDELFSRASSGMSVTSWISLFFTSFLETVGLRYRDPILRMKDESMTEWAERRRNIETARASKSHGERTCAEFSKLLMDDRDERFASFVRQAIEEESDGNIVAIVGLVHLDGVCERIMDWDTGR